MNVTPIMFLIVCPCLFLAGLIDSMAGGGGLISLPAFMIAGLSPHLAIATNKLSSTCGTTLTTARFMKNKLINVKLAIPSVIAAIMGSSLGAHLSMGMSEHILQTIMMIILPVAAFVVLNRRLFHDNGNEEIKLDIRTIIVATLSAFVIGMYDGMYGPGTGTFLIIAFTVFAYLGIKSANDQAKVINLTTNITALVIFLMYGLPVIPLGLAGAACSMIGNYIGSGLVMSRGSKIVKPAIIGVLIVLFIRILFERLGII